MEPEGRVFLLPPPPGRSEKTPGKKPRLKWAFRNKKDEQRAQLPGEDGNGDGEKGEMRARRWRRSMVFGQRGAVSRGKQDKVKNRRESGDRTAEVLSWRPSGHIGPVVFYSVNTVIRYL